MRLSLSSAAAPDAALADLFAACARRGFAALELVEGHAHGVSIGTSAEEAEAALAAARGAGLEVAAFRRETLDREELETAAALAASLDTVLVVDGDGLDPDLLPAATKVFHEAGTRLFISRGSEPATVELHLRSIESLTHREALGLAWEIHPEHDAPESIDGMLAIAGSSLRYVRWFGGGPEAVAQTGFGVGALMARLALGRYAGPLVLTPGNPRHHQVWRAWLGRAGGWGCGSKQSDSSLVTLEREVHPAGGYR